MAGSIHLTKRSITAIQLTAKRAFYYDTETPGLELQVTAGAKVFYYKYRMPYGQSERVKIGAFPGTSPAAARKQLSILHARVTKGENPAEDASDARRELTFGAAFEEYLTRHAKAHKRSWAQDQGHYKRYLSPWAGRRLSRITLNDVQRLHAQIGETGGKVVANRVLALLRTMFGLLKTWGYCQVENPAIGVKRFQENPRQRFLSKPEIQAFLKALDEESDVVAADLLRILLYTGVRKANALSMRWDQIDRLDAQAVWTIPQTKSGHPVRIALSMEAVAVLRRRKAADDASPHWVFQGTGASGHFEDPKRAFRRVCERAGITNATVHTLRHTVASWMTIEGYSLQIVGKALGHRSIRSTQGYSHLTIDPVRAATQAIATMMNTPLPSFDDEAHGQSA